MGLQLAMTPTEQLFLEDCQSGDPSALLVYADWLDEQGRGQEAEWWRDYPSPPAVVCWFSYARIFYRGHGHGDGDGYGLGYSGGRGDGEGYGQDYEFGYLYFFRDEGYGRGDDQDNGEGDGHGYS